MRKRKSPQDKKSLAYARDHYVAAYESRHAYRNNWHIKKSRLHHVNRQQTREALRALELFGNEASIEDAPIEATSGQLGTVNPRLKFFKAGVWTLAEYLKRGQDERKERGQSNRTERLERKAEYEEMILALEKDARSRKAAKLLLEIAQSPSHVWQFLRENPEWKPRLKAGLAQIKRAKAKAAKQRRIKQTQIQRTKSLVVANLEKVGSPKSGGANS